MKYKMPLIFATALTLTSCDAFDSDACEVAVREAYEGKTIWVRNVSTYKNLVYTSDSVLLLVSSAGMKYPYISDTDTLKTK